MTYNQGEIVYDETNGTLRLLDGVTQGGIALANQAWTQTQINTAITTNAKWPVADTNGINGPLSIAIGFGAGNTNQTTLGIAIGAGSGSSNQSFATTAVGANAGQQSQGVAATSMGWSAGQVQQGIFSIAVGALSGQYNQGDNAVAVGQSAGNYYQGANAVAVGIGAGLGTNQGGMGIGQGANAVAVGYSAGTGGQGVNAIAVGTNAAFGYACYAQAGTSIGLSGSTITLQDPSGIILPGMRVCGVGFTTQTVVSVISPTQIVLSAPPDNTFMPMEGIKIVGVQGINAVAIGSSAGQYNQGENAIAIGNSAGYQAQAARTIILNATGTALNGVANQTNSLYINPIRNSTTQVTNHLYYNTTTKEVTYGPQATTSTLVNGNYIVSIDNAGNFNVPTGQLNLNSDGYPTVQSIGFAVNHPSSKLLIQSGPFQNLILKTNGLYDWKFDTNGTLTAPGNITTPGSITAASATIGGVDLKRYVDSKVWLALAVGL
jgi:hypothetical protein